jgi:hypothetical protein
MATFSLHIRLDDTGDPGDGHDILAPFTEEYEDVDFTDADLRTDTAGKGFVPETSALAIEHLEDFAEIYDALQQESLVATLNLWGPESERFPIPVQHYALQQIPDPDLFEYYAIDDQVTLVVADDKMAAEEIRRQVPDAALGYSSSPF